MDVIDLQNEPIIKEKYVLSYNFSKSYINFNKVVSEKFFLLINAMLKDTHLHAHTQNLI